MPGTSPPLAEALNQVLSLRGDELREALLVRWLATAARALQRIPKPKLGQAAAASTDVEVVLRTLEATEMIGSGDPDGVLSTARARGLEARQQLLDAEGGPWSVGRVASHLRVSRQAVDNRRRAGRLLAVTVGRRGYLYPSWQFGTNGVVPGLDLVLKTLAAHDAWGTVIFMLSPNDRLEGRTPLDALRRGRTDEVNTAASIFGEHGAT